MVFRFENLHAMYAGVIFGVHAQMLRQNTLDMKRSGANVTEVVFNAKMIQNMFVYLLQRDRRVAAEFARDLAIFVDSHVHVEQQASDRRELAHRTGELILSEFSPPPSPVELCFVFSQAALRIGNELAVFLAAGILSVVVTLLHVICK